MAARLTRPLQLPSPVTRAGESGVSRNAAASVPAAVPNAFDWGAAGIGAIVAILAVLLGLGVTRLIPRRRRAQLV
jgi:hypothetical protein